MNYKTELLEIAEVFKKMNVPVVFTGGATLDLYTDDTAKEEVRYTVDIDVVIELTTYATFALLEEKLRKVGFKNKGTMLSRYDYKGLQVDIMSTNTVLNMTNKWYAVSFDLAEDVLVEDGQSIRLFPFYSFIACKLEAYLGRGSGDMRTSHDFEDIVYVINNNTHAAELLQQAPVEIKEYLKEQFSYLMKQSVFEEAIAGHMASNEGLRKNRVMDILKGYTK